MLKIVGLAVLLLFLPTGIGIAWILVPRVKRLIDLRLSAMEERHYQQIQEDYQKSLEGRI